MEQTFEIRVQNVPGILARVESIFRRQRAPIRGFFLEGEEGSTARLTITAVASGEGANLLRKQLMRLIDVHDIADSGEMRAFTSSESSFNFEERRA
ncbi:MAG TPA: ACT domain-containing protein [Thermoanaerobaculia bacterium]|nr:ACT domain-containing protein [Thermoanaerobaculia bacterium]